MKLTNSLRSRMIQVMNCIECLTIHIKILPRVRIPLCKSRELSQRGHSMSQLCSIRHDIPVPLHTPEAYGQCSMCDHSGDKQSVVLGTRYETLSPWYDQSEVGWSQPLQLWLSAGIYLVGPVLVSRGRDLGHLTAECKSWPVASNLCSGRLPEFYTLVEGLFC